MGGGKTRTTMRDAPERLTYRRVLRRPDNIPNRLRPCRQLQQQTRQPSHPVENDEISQSRHGQALPALPLHPQYRPQRDLTDGEEEECPRREGDVERGEGEHLEKDAEVAEALAEGGVGGGELDVDGPPGLGEGFDGRRGGRWLWVTAGGGGIEEGKEVVRNRVSMVMTSSSGLRLVRRSLPPSSCCYRRAIARKRDFSRSSSRSRLLRDSRVLSKCVPIARRLLSWPGEESGEVSLVNAAVGTSVGGGGGGRGGAEGGGRGGGGGERDSLVLVFFPDGVDGPVG